MESILFYGFGGLTIGLALAVILQPNPVGAAMALVGSFFGVAALYALLHAHFVAVMQVLLYAGAIMVFFVFVVMLLNLEPKSLRWQALTGSRLVWGSAAVLFGGLFAFILTMMLRPMVADSTLQTGTLEAIGRLLLSKYVVPFEILSVLLLVAIIGAVVMGKRDLS
jgi:NADH-quinone oxidoreductase subunit J